jgi:VanZ family protein
MKWYRWFPALAWMGVIFVLSSRPGQQLPTVDNCGPIDWIWRQGGHLVEYITLAVLFHFALHGGPMGRVRLGWALGLAVAYGISDEWHQHLVPGRSCNLEDVLFNSAGAVLGCVGLRWRQRRLAASVEDRDEDCVIREA